MTTTSHKLSDSFPCPHCGLAAGITAEGFSVHALPRCARFNNLSPEAFARWASASRTPTDGLWPTTRCEPPYVPSGDPLAEIAGVLAALDRAPPGSLLAECGVGLVLARAFVLNAPDLERLRALPGVRFVDGFEVSTDGQVARFAVTTIGVGRREAPRL